MKSKLLLTLTVALVGLSVFVQESPGARILSAAFFSTKSHKITYDLLLEELANRGHEVTVLSPFPTNKNITNLREIKSIDLEYLFENDKMPNMFEMKENNQQINPFAMFELFADVCTRTLAEKHVTDLLNEKFDLIIAQPAGNECTMGYLSKFQVPMVLVVPLGVPGSLVRIIGSPSPVSFVPNIFTGYDEKMNFRERLINALVETFISGFFKFYMAPRMETLYRNALGDQTLPGYEEIFKNSSLLLSNSHFSMSGKRPFLPDVIEVGGMHCRPAKPLPKDLEDFAQSSGSDGFIFFSMGSALKGSMMPDKHRKIILSAFSKLKQKVLWKWETETMEDLPLNVKLIKWAPQQDILGHPKIRAFITHGGLGSTTEAVYHGVPLIGIPMFGDQILNMQKSISSGYAYSLEYSELTEEKIIEAVNTVLGDPKYRENVQTLSAIFRDQPMKALDRAVYWTEYVLRHNGAAHLRSPARDLNFFQYHSLDVVGFILFVFLASLYIVILIIKFSWRKFISIFAGKNESSKLSKKRD